MRLALDAHPLEVVSLLSETPDRLTPFGVRPLPETPAPIAAGGGRGGRVRHARRALGLSAGRAAAAGARRQTARAGGGRAARDAGARGPRRARAALEADPRAAADAAATVLRRFLSERFGVPAPARTSQELAAMTPPSPSPPAAAGVVALLRSLDERQLRRPPKPPGGAARLAPLLDAGRAFVDQPCGPRRRDERRARPLVSALGADALGGPACSWLAAAGLLAPLAALRRRPRRSPQDLPEALAAGAARREWLPRCWRARLG